MQTLDSELIFWEVFLDTCNRNTYIHVSLTSQNRGRPHNDLRSFNGS